MFLASNASTNCSAPPPVTVTLCKYSAFRILVEKPIVFQCVTSLITVFEKSHHLHIFRVNGIDPYFTFFFKLHFNIILPSTAMVPKQFLSWWNGRNADSLFLVVRSLAEQKVRGGISLLSLVNITFPPGPCYPPNLQATRLQCFCTLRLTDLKFCITLQFVSYLTTLIFRNFSNWIVFGKE